MRRRKLHSTTPAVPAITTSVPTITTPSSLSPVMLNNSGRSTTASIAGTKNKTMLSSNPEAPRRTHACESLPLASKASKTASPSTPPGRGTPSTETSHSHASHKSTNPPNCTHLLRHASARMRRPPVCIHPPASHPINPFIFAIMSGWILPRSTLSLK